MTVPVFPWISPRLWSALFVTVICGSNDFECVWIQILILKNILSYLTYMLWCFPNYVSTYAVTEWALFLFCGFIFNLIRKIILFGQPFPYLTQSCFTFSCLMIQFFFFMAQWDKRKTDYIMIDNDMHNNPPFTSVSLSRISNL